MKIINVVGTRPNFVKISPLIREMKKHQQIKPLLVHTGQHYDEAMSEVFFRDLGIPKPNIHLGVGSASHCEQIARIMAAFEKTCLQEKPDLIVVVGDVNSTLAAALAGAKMNIRIAHIEAGLRSFDKTMPEEVNRILTDQLSDYLFITEESGRQNLIKEGISQEKIFFAGNIMIDTLVYNLPKINRLNRYSEADYCVLTMHRSSNVDAKAKLQKLIGIIKDISKQIKVVFPAHPRTKKKIKEFDIENTLKGIAIIEPMGYLEFISLVKNAKFVLTDSGGLQEETTYLGIPCITLRATTERPVTVETGANVVVGADSKKIIGAVESILSGKIKKWKIPQYWDGKTASRIINALLKI